MPAVLRVAMCELLALEGIDGRVLVVEGADLAEQYCASFAEFVKSILEGVLKSRARVPADAPEPPADARDLPPEARDLPPEVAVKGKGKGSAPEPAPEAHVVSPPQAPEPQKERTLSPLILSYVSKVDDQVRSNVERGVLPATSKQLEDFIQKVVSRMQVFFDRDGADPPISAAASVALEQCFQPGWAFFRNERLGEITPNALAETIVGARRMLENFFDQQPRP